MGARSGRGRRGTGSGGLRRWGPGATLHSLAHPAASLVGAVLCGLGLPLPLITTATEVQKRAPAHLLGRATATANTLMFAHTALGQGAGAALVTALDPRAQYLMTALLAATTALTLHLGRRTWRGR
ncbi:putative integral membrane efflux protein [Streptomyces sp. Tu6071]|uniref:hypothetical protein n=1 Tax=Streptomyces sp. Tu6071 TaxID=355249 RepID=UPI00020E5FCA|nr:hypothetical protein [Streptomyces sp. Tu6071]EGJ78282.1 putative integral membrane efflux protein [Streptomyces sp. Tu6071]